MSGKRGNSALPSLGKTRGKGYTPHTPNHSRKVSTSDRSVSWVGLLEAKLSKRGSDMGERTDTLKEYMPEELELAMMGFVPRCGWDGFRYWKLLERVDERGRQREIAFVLITILRPDVMARYQVQDRSAGKSVRFSVWATAKAKIVEIIEGGP